MNEDIRTSRANGVVIRITLVGIVLPWLVSACHDEMVPSPSAEPMSCEPVQPTPRCEPDRCGNGAVDPCPDGYDEQCDGEVIRETCASQGYPGGTLRCDARCRHDYSECSVCLDDERSDGCGLVPLEPAPSWAPETALGPGGLGLAYSSRLAHGIQFAVLDEDLVPMGPPTCIDFDGYAEDLAATPDGWWLVARDDGEHTGRLMALEPGGEVRLARDLAAHYHARLSTTGGFPLLTYTDADVPSGAPSTRHRFVAERLDPDGTARWRTELPDWGIGGVASIAVEGGYLVRTPGTPTVTLAHLSAEGEVTVADDRLDPLIDARLYDDGGPVVIYATTYDLERYEVVRVDAYGRPLSEPVVLPELASVLAMRSGRLLQARTRLEGSDRLEVGWLELSSGGMVEPPLALAELPLPSPGRGSAFFDVRAVDVAGPVVLWLRGDLAAGLMATRIEE